jgi:L-ascorbate metabolism protein UlaG (beta-lactamase superfamily)
MEVKYLLHSGVLVKSNESVLIFDYYKKGIEEKDISDAASVYVFVSHSHGDHFDKKIFEWEKINSNITYILSSDIDINDSDRILKMALGEELNLNGIKITTLDSTDEGVAFVVETDEGTVFHAGDLNWWHWEGEPDDYNAGMAEKFKREISKMIGTVIDIAFIPVDKRLEKAAYLSIDYLMEQCDVRKVYPIHFMDDWNYINQVKLDLADRNYYNKICFYGR